MRGEVVHAPGAVASPVEADGDRGLWADKSVLVADDDDGIAEVLRQALGQELGAYSVVAHDGREALAWIRRLRPTLVVLDVAMPRLDGCEVTRRLRADPATRAIPVILISAVGPPERTAAAARACGANAFLAKPFEMQDFLDVVHRWLLVADGSDPGLP